MARQLDLYKIINRHSKAIKVLEQHMLASNEVCLSVYSHEMNRFITRRLVKQWNRYLLWLKIKRVFGFKSAKAITGPIVVNSYTK